jgi:hypothetical protein
MKIITIAIFIALSTNVFAQNVEKEGIVFPISSETPYKTFVSYMTLRNSLRLSAKIIYTEKVIANNILSVNECVLFFDNRNCMHTRFNLLKKQDSIQYLSNGYLLYTVFHKTKEVIIEDSILEKGLELMKDNPYAYYYTIGDYLDIKKKSNVSMFSNNEFVVINYPRKQGMLYREGIYSYKFRACDFALYKMV